MGFLRRFDVPVPPVGSLVETVILFAVAGLIVSAGEGIAEITRQGYLQLGFWQQLSGLLLDRLTRGVVRGAAIGAVYVLFWCAGLASHAAVKRVFFRSDSNRRAHSGRDFLLVSALITLLLSFGLLGFAAVLQGMVGPKRIGLVMVGAAVFWSILQLLYRRSAAGTKVGPDLSHFSELLLQGLYTLPFMVAAVLFALDDRYKGFLANGEVAIAAIVALIVLSVGMVAIARSTVDRRVLDHHGGPLSWLSWVGTLLLAGLFVMRALAPTVVSPGLESANPQNVILIGIDTLRGDHTTLQEPGAGDRDLTPSLRRLASDGVWFTKAISQAPWTMPAFASVLTGKYPRLHGAISLTGSLGASQTTLAEVLREAGYETLAVVSHLFVDSAHGFDQGFLRFDEEYSTGHQAVTSEAITDKAIGLLEGRSEKPFFMFLHYFDPHYRWVDHENWSFSNEYEGWLQDIIRNYPELHAKRYLFDESDTRFLIDRYDEEIAYTDLHIGRLLDYLEHAGLRDTTAIIVVADHGEEFMEKGWLGHTTSLFDEQVNVPLILRLPGATVRGARLDNVVETRAIFATLLDHLRVDFGRDAGFGSLLPILSSAEANDLANTEDGEAFSEVWLPDTITAKRQRLSALRTDGWKLIRDHEREQDRLFRLSRDPTESTDVSSTEPEILQALGERLGIWLNWMDGAAAPVISDEPGVELREQLKALGYLDE